MTNIQKHAAGWVLQSESIMFRSWWVVLSINANLLLRDASLCLYPPFHLMLYCPAPVVKAWLCNRGHIPKGPRTILKFLAIWYPAEPGVLRQTKPCPRVPVCRKGTKCRLPIDLISDRRNASWRIHSTTQSLREDRHVYKSLEYCSKISAHLTSQGKCQTAWFQALCNSTSDIFIKQMWCPSNSNHKVAWHVGSNRLNAFSYSQHRAIQQKRKPNQQGLIQEPQQICIMKVWKHTGLQETAGPATCKSSTKPGNKSKYTLFILHLLISRSYTRFRHLSTQQSVPWSFSSRTASLGLKMAWFQKRCSTAKLGH